MKNIKVSTKLLLGFGTVLVLTAILAASTIFNISDLMMRGENTRIVNDILTTVQHLESESAAYEVDPSESGIARVHQLISDLRTHVAEVESKLTHPDGMAAISGVKKLTTQYQQQFDGYVIADREEQGNIEFAVEQGAVSDQLLARVNEVVNGSSSRPVKHETIYEVMTGRLASDLLLARRHMAYMSRSIAVEGPDALPALQESYQQVLAVIDQIRPRLTGEQLTLLEQGTESLHAYYRSIEGMVAAMKQQAAASIEMEETSAELTRNASRVVEIQNMYRTQVASRTYTSTIVLTLLAIGVGGLIGFMIVRQISAPLNQAVSIARTLGERDMSGNGVEQRGDEFGILLHALDMTRSNLRGALGEVQGVTTQLAAAAEQLSVVTNQTSAGVSSQRMETEQVATAMNEMTATVQEVAQNSEEAAAAAQRADDLARQGNQVLQTALEEITRLSSEVADTTTAMHKLSEDSTSINTVLTVINGIAEQTNLLALNAAIEAARAGEAGRGFAVVADEVRGLAQRTQASTAEIESLIANLQHGADTAVNLTNSSNALAGSTLELAQEAGNELEAIARTVSEIQAMNIQIATAAEEQSSVAEEINRSIINVNSIADQSAAAVEETAASANELAQLGQLLQNQVGLFRL